MRQAWWWMAVLAACAAPVDDDTDDTDETDVEDTDDTDAGDTDDEGLAFEDVITVTAATTGDLTCLLDDGEFRTWTADPSCVNTVDLTGDIEDFESGDGVGGITIEFFFDDVIDGTPDATTVSVAGGAVEGVVAPTCTTWASRALGIEGETKTTIQLHWSEPDTDPLDTFFNTVAVGSFELISALVSIEPDPTMGALAGTVYDCAGEGSMMEGVQIVVKKGGIYPSSQEIRYFVNEFPSVVQPQTSEDGLWLVANVPVGPAVVEAWAVVGAGEEPTLIARTEVVVEPDSFVIADIYASSGDGKVLPESCLTSCDDPV